MASYANQLLVKALGSCRDAEVSEEVYTEVNLARPEQRSFQSGLGLRVNIDGRLGYAWSEGELLENDILEQAVKSAADGVRGSFSQKGLTASATVPDPQDGPELLEDSIKKMQVLIQGLDFMLPSLLPHRRFVLSARILQHTLKLTTRSGERRASRRLHLLTLNSNEAIPVNDAIYSTQPEHSPAEILCRLTWRAVHSNELAWPEVSDTACVFTPTACAKLLEDFAEDLLSMRSPAFDDIPKNVPWLSPRVNLWADGTLPGGFGTVPFDGEGLTHVPVALVVEGRLQHGLGDLSAARSHSEPPLGLAVRPWAAPPRCGYSNLCLGLGDQSMGELCTKVGFGILLDRLTPLPKHMKKAGEFARRCHTAFILQHGRPVCRIPQLIVRARYEDLLGPDLLGLGHERVLCGRSLCAPLAVRRVTLEEADIDPAEKGSDYPELWW